MQEPGLNVPLAKGVPLGNGLVAASSRVTLTALIELLSPTFAKGTNSFPLGLTSSRFNACMSLEVTWLSNSVTSGRLVAAPVTKIFDGYGVAVLAIDRASAP